jgi:hypothetical protein
MQYAPDVYLLFSLDVENQIGETFALPEAQAGKIEFVRVAG